MNRPEAVSLLRKFNSRLDANPEYARRARSRPLDQLLNELYGSVPNEVLDEYILAVKTHGLTWDDIAVDVHSLAGEMIGNALRQF